MDAPTCLIGRAQCTSSLTSFPQTWRLLKLRFGQHPAATDVAGILEVESQIEVAFIMMVDDVPRCRLAGVDAADPKLNSLLKRLLLELQPDRGLRSSRERYWNASPASYRPASHRGHLVLQKGANPPDAPT